MKLKPIFLLAILVGIYSCKETQKTELSLDGTWNSIGYGQQIHINDSKVGIYDVYENGQLKQQSNFKDGKEDGKFTSYYENGQLKKEVNYINGEEDGVYKSWYENGQLKQEGNYKYENEVGSLRFWHENGQH